MTMLRRITPLTGLLLVFCVILLIIIWLESLATNNPDSVNYKTSLSVDKNLKENVVNVNFELPPISNYTEIMERPLFSETRRPIETESDNGGLQTHENDVPASAGNIGAYRLIGVLLTDSMKTAYVFDSRTQKLQRLSNGDEIEEWSISEISADTVILNKPNGKTRELLLWQQPLPTQGKDSTQYIMNQNGEDSTESENQDSTNSNPIVDEEIEELMGSGDNIVPE